MSQKQFINVSLKLIHKVTGDVVGIDTQCVDVQHVTDVDQMNLGETIVDGIVKFLQWDIRNFKIEVEFDYRDQANG